MTSPDLRRPDRRTRVDSSACAPADAVPMPHARGLPRWHHAGALIVFVVLALASSYPLPFHLGTHIPGDASGDAATFVWNGWWMRTALESGTTPFRTPYLFAPYGTSLVLHTHTALPAFVTATVLEPFSLVLSTNLVILVALVMNGFCAYLLARSMTDSTGPSLVAGVIYGSSPFVAARLLGHFNLVHVWTIPLGAWCAWQARQTGRRSWAAATGFAIAASAYVDYYLALYAASFIGMLALLERLTLVRLPGARSASSARIAQVAWTVAGAALAVGLVIAVTGGAVIDIADVRIIARRATNMVTVAWVAAVAGIAFTWGSRVRLVRRRTPEAVAPPQHRQVLALSLPFVVLIPLATAALALWTSGDYVSQTYLWRSGPSGIDVATLLLGNPWHPLTGTRTRAIYAALRIDPIEGSAWLGAAFLLTLLLAGRWSGSEIGRRLAAAGGIFFVLALGPWLMVAGHRTGILLPGLAARWIPILNNARIPGRAVLVVYLVMALLVAIGLARRARGTGVMMPLLASLVIVADYIAVPLPLDRIAVPRLYETIAHTPGAVLELPFGFRDGFGQAGRFDGQVLLNQTVHGRPILGGFVARLSPVLRDRYMRNPVVQSLLTASTGTSIPGGRMTSDAQVAREMLSTFGVTTVVLNRRTAPAALVEYVERVLPIVPTAHESELTVYAVRRPNPTE